MNHYRIIKGDIWDSEVGVADLILFTANSFVTKEEELVMGAGFAKQVKIRYPYFPEMFGEYAEHLEVYGLILPGIEEGGSEWGAFQVKKHFKGEADIRLIQYAAKMLWDYWKYYERIVMNFPGAGNGKLPINRVLPIVPLLPPNVYLYTYRSPFNKRSERGREYHFSRRALP